MNKSFRNCSNKITDILDKYASITKHSLKEMKTSNKQWLNKDILKWINQKMPFTEDVLESKISISKKFTT